MLQAAPNDLVLLALITAIPNIGAGLIIDEPHQVIIGLPREREAESVDRFSCS